MTVATVEGLGAVGEGGQEIAQVGVPVRARRAAAAGGDEPEHHVIAGLEPVDAVSHLLHDPGTFVAADHRRRRYEARDVAVHGVLVGVAHARGHHLDQHLIVFRRIEFDLLDTPRLVVFPQHRCSSSHEVPLRS